MDYYIEISPGTAHSQQIKELRAFIKFDQQAMITLKIFQTCLGIFASLV